jgi:MFS family permease
VGCLPSYQSIGVAAPIALVVLRLLQGLALGGEYGGAATYVAEHAPEGRRGFYTSWIQTTATLGLFLSLLVILGCRMATGDDFEKWGWRIPFLMSAVLLAVSVYIRLQLHESPVFQSMKEEGTLSKAPLKEALGKWSNLKLVLLALFGATAGQAVVWYGGQFYALFFIEKILQVASQEANLIVAVALLLGTPLFVVFGALSDRIGRKPIILAGMVLAVVTYFPVFKGITHFANPALEAAVAAHPVTVVADPADCSFQFDPVGKKTFSNSCDVAKTALAKAGVPYVNEVAPAGTVASVRLGNGAEARVVPSFRGEAMENTEFKPAAAAFGAALKQELQVAGYPAKADLAQVNYPMVVALCTWLMLLVAMVYGPIAAWLVELFPASVRYTSMSLPYHLGNGWFGGFLPTISFALVAASGNIYQGLWYPVIIAAVTAVIGAFTLHETHRSRVV